MADESVLIGVCGGTGSGKTTLVELIRQRIGHSSLLVLRQDSYYRNLEHLPKGEREGRNFDHPDSYERDLFVNHLRDLRAGRPIRAPVYDFRSHTRSGYTTLGPGRVVIVEGILIFADEELRSCFDLRVFVDAPDDIRLLRRIERDQVERGRSLDSVRRQYLETVRPGHEQFVAPARQYAHVIVNGTQEFRPAVDLLAAWIESALGR